MPWAYTPEEREAVERFESDLREREWRDEMASRGYMQGDTGQGLPPGWGPRGRGSGRGQPYVAPGPWPNTVIVSGPGGRGHIMAERDLPPGLRPGRGAYGGSGAYGHPGSGRGMGRGRGPVFGRGTGRGMATNRGRGMSNYSRGGRGDPGQIRSGASHQQAGQNNPTYHPFGSPGGATMMAPPQVFDDEDPMDWWENGRQHSRAPRQATRGHAVQGHAGHNRAGNSRTGRGQGDDRPHVTFHGEQTLRPPARTQHPASRPPQTRAPRMQGGNLHTAGVSEAEIPCPHGDNRFPPLGLRVDTPCVLNRHPVTGKPEYFYKITLQNPAPGMKAMHDKAIADGRAAMRAKNINHAQEAKMAVMQGIHTKALKELSDGRRGKIYLLERRNEHIVGCIADMGVFQGVQYRLLGVGLRKIAGCYIILAEKV